MCSYLQTHVKLQDYNNSNNNNMHGIKEPYHKFICQSVGSPINQNAEEHEVTFKTYTSQAQSSSIRIYDKFQHKSIDLLEDKFTEEKFNKLWTKVLISKRSYSSATVTILWKLWQLLTKIHECLLSMSQNTEVPVTRKSASSISFCNFHKLQ